MQDNIRYMFFDGKCGLCHGFVRFVLFRLKENDRVLVAPLGGKTFESKVPDALKLGLPDSIVVYTENSHILVKARAVASILKSLGGFYYLLGCCIAASPTLLADSGYDFIAKLRRRFFSTPDTACPIVPQHLTKFIENE